MPQIFRDSLVDKRRVADIRAPAPERVKLSIRILEFIYARKSAANLVRLGHRSFAQHRRRPAQHRVQQKLLRRKHRRFVIQRAGIDHHACSSLTCPTFLMSPEPAALCLGPSPSAARLCLCSSHSVAASSASAAHSFYRLHF